MSASESLSGVRASIAAGTLLGIGMGGFVDGILFHQILQLHNMLSNWVVRDTLVNEQINMFWDGLFHAFTWMTTAAGIYLLWEAARHKRTVPSGRALAGSLLLGWGLFNVVEGTIDHEILQVHHVYQNGNMCFGIWCFWRRGWCWCSWGGAWCGRSCGGVRRRFSLASRTDARAA